MWFVMLEKLKLDAMPHNMRTQWNSTYDMLEFAVQHWMAINDIAGNKAANLHQYELCDEEWTIAEQLCETLRVRMSHFQRQMETHVHHMQIFKEAMLFFSCSTPNLATAQ